MLDQYDAGMLDDREVAGMTYEQRLAAEAAMAARDGVAGDADLFAAGMCFAVLAAG